LMQGNPLMEGRITLAEGVRTVFSNVRARDTLDEISFIKRAIYIESPFKSIPQSVTATELDIGDRFFRIKEDIAPASVERMAELRDVISGEVDFVKEFEDDDPAATAATALLGRNGRWMYRRSDGGSFELDDEVELKGQGDVVSVVKMSKQDLTAEEVAQHLQSGKYVTQMGLVWRDRISFILTEDFALKRIRFLDILQDELAQTGEDAESLAIASQLLFSENLSLLIAELVHCLDGWLPRQ
ncbi:MAG: recombination-associated protein RdgC, partial [Neisseriaceae bacterium]|nr:recombination-associated protein RdgC [Neisseriaceae bacterium]